ncbi:MAG TPA: hypothetical protein DEH78_04000 [Solibacterales bacterium]|nr:hypothetical protein [Bryobacterales bacterium]
MARNDDGEFELILGNKQLLSVFGVVVVLFGVFFAMGYIVGRNSGGDRAQAAAARPIVIEPGSPPPSATSAPQNPPASTPASSPAAEPSSPAQSAPPPAVPEPAATKPDTKAAEPSKEAAATPPPGTPIAGELPPGKYWQVTAVKRPEAELIVELLSKKGFSARMVPVPGLELLRVLVGPGKDTADLAKLKSDLEAAGYKQPIPRTY